MAAPAPTCGRSRNATLAPAIPERPLAPNIILIGPVGVGKSTQAQLLAERLGRPRCSMDALRWDYYREIGYDEDEAARIRQDQGFAGLYRYWKPFEAHAVERLLAQTRGSIIDLGGGHSVYEDDALLIRVERAMRAGGVAVLLLPAPDLDESVQLLRQGRWDGMAGEFDVHAHFVKQPSNHRLAQFVVFTKGKTPEQTRDEILSFVTGDPTPAASCSEQARDDNPSLSLLFPMFPPNFKLHTLINAHCR